MVPAGSTPGTLGENPNANLGSDSVGTAGAGSSPSSRIGGIFKGGGVSGKISADALLLGVRSAVSCCGSLGPHFVWPAMHSDSLAQSANWFGAGLTKLS